MCWGLFIYLQIYCGNGFTVLSKIDKKMTQMIMKTSQETSGNNMNRNEKDFKKIGDVEMNQIEIVGNDKEYQENVKETHKQLMTNNINN